MPEAIRDHACREHRGEDANHLRQLEQAIRSCGVSFHIWQKREPTGKPIPGRWLDSPHRQTQAPSFEDAAREDEFVTARRHLSKNSCSVEGRCKHSNANLIITYRLPICMLGFCGALQHHDELEPHPNWDWQIPSTDNLSSLTISELCASQYWAKKSYQMWCCIFYLCRPSNGSVTLWS